MPSLELDVEAKTSWKERQLAIEDKKLAMKELRKRLKACGCSTAGSKDVLLKRYLELPDSRKRRGVLPSPKSKRRKAQKIESDDSEEDDDDSDSEFEEDDESEAEVEAEAEIETEAEAEAEAEAEVEVEAEAEVEVEVEAAEPNEDDEGNESEAENQLIIAAMRKPDGIDYKTLWEGHDLNACMKWPVLCWTQVENPSIGQELVGHTLELCWKLSESGMESSSGRRKWLTAKVTAYNAINYLHIVEYVLDGEIEELNLVEAQRDWRLLPNGL